MTQITLIRHGQANFGAKTEEEYDRLSDIGHQQAAWVGEYIRNSGQNYDHLHCGTLRRHRETAKGMDMGGFREDARLNELEYFTLANEFNAQSGMEMPGGIEEFSAHLPLVFRAWKAGDLDNVYIPYDAFAQRMKNAVDEAIAQEGKHLFVTSGGVIAMMITRLLGLGSDGFAQMMLPVYNSSINVFDVAPWGLHMDGYNMIPHLDRTDRAHARTRV